MTTLTFTSGYLDPGSRASEVISMREKLEILRDVMIALGLQIVFRATILLRRWNY